MVRTSFSFASFVKKLRDVRESGKAKHLDLAT